MFGKKREQKKIREILAELDNSTEPSEMPRRIELCGKALKMISKDEEPELWGMLQDDLACSLLESPIGSHDENIESAINHFGQALEIRTRQEYPKEWAITQNNLATAYRDRIHGDQADNIEQAIRLYDQVLILRTCKSDPVQWALTRHNLAVAYYRRVREDRTENIEQAVNILEELLALGIHLKNSDERASIQHNLSTFLLNHKRNGAENIERAIIHCQQALEIFAFGDHPNHWASLQHNLGNAHRYRLYGDRIQNIEQAISHFQQALIVRTPEKFPKEWAETLNDLGSCYLTRKQGEPEENIELGLSLFEQVLAVHTRVSFPKGWAQARNNLGNAYQSRIRGEKEQNFEKAIDNYRQALEIRTREAFPEDWAETLNNLANIERIRASGKDLDQAIQHLLQVLDVYTLESYPQFCARTHNNLAIMYSERQQGTRSENIDRAVQHYWQALEVYTPRDFPDRCLYSARALGNLAFEEQRWDLAKQSYDLAFEAQDVLMHSSISSTSEKSELTEIQNLPPRAAYAHYKSGAVRRAVEVLEKGRAQLLRESFELQRQNLERLRVPKFQHLYDDYIQARDEYRSLQGAGTAADWKRSQEKLQLALSAIREKAGRDHPEYRYFLRTLTFAEIQEQAREKPLVYLIATHAGGVALIVSGEEVHALELPELEQESLQKQIWRPSNEEVDRINTHLRQGYIEPEDVQAVSGGYFSMYALRRLLENISPELSHRLQDAWENTLDETTRWLWDVAMGRLIPILKKYGDAAMLIPAGQLALLPLHAAWKEDKVRITSRLYALDEINITYAPSAHALCQALLSAKRQTENLLIVDNADGSLQFSKDEAISASNAFPHFKHLSGKHATVETVKEEMQKHHVLLFSTHGQAGWVNPEEARLDLADQHSLTLPEIFKLDLNHARLAILSACETGIPGLELIDEMISLPAGMMQAGIPGVIGSLWRVNEGSTAVLMASFYGYWRKEGKSPQEALRQAQIWLRDTLFESPYHWAAFTYTGV